MKSANYVVTPAVTRSDDDEDDDEATPEEHRNLRRVVGKSQFLAPRWPDIAIATHRLARSLAKPTKSDIVASKRLLRYLCGTLDLGWKLLTRKHDVHDFDSVHRQRCASDRPARQSVSSWVILPDSAFISGGPRTHQWLLSHRVKPSTSPTPQHNRSKAHPSFVLTVRADNSSHKSSFRQHSRHWSGKQKMFDNALFVWTAVSCGCRQRLQLDVFKSAMYLGPRTWPTETPNLQTDVRSNSVARAW